MTALTLASLARLALTGGLIIAAVILGAWIYRMGIRDAWEIMDEQDRPAPKRDGIAKASEREPSVEVANARQNASKWPMRSSVSKEPITPSHPSPKPR